MMRDVRRLKMFNNGFISSIRRIAKKLFTNSSPGHFLIEIGLGIFIILVLSLGILSIGYKYLVRARLHQAISHYNAVAIEVSDAIQIGDVKYSSEDETIENDFSNAMSERGIDIEVPTSIGGYYTLEKADPDEGGGFVLVQGRPQDDAPVSQCTISRSDAQSISQRQATIKYCCEGERCFLTMRV